MHYLEASKKMRIGLACSLPNPLSILTLAPQQLTEDHEGERAQQHAGAERQNLRQAGGEAELSPDVEWERDASAGQEEGNHELVEGSQEAEDQGGEDRRHR